MQTPELAVKHRFRCCGFVIGRCQVLLALLLAVTSGACSGAAPSEGGIALATSSPGKFDAGCPAALIEGTLESDLGSGTAVVAGAERAPVIWPFGYTARDASGTVEVVDDHGAVVARTGESVRLGGGGITGDGRWSTCGPPLERD